MNAPPCPSVSVRGSKTRPIPGLAAPVGRTSLRIQEVAAWLRVTSQHVTNLVRRGRFGKVDTSGKPSTWRIPVENWRRFLAESDSLAKSK